MLIFQNSDLLSVEVRLATDQPSNPEIFNVEHLTPPFTIKC
jgi:hypothetical protein